MSICVEIKDLVLSKQLMYGALCDCYAREFSKTRKPLKVKVLNDGKYGLLDGYHRLIELMVVWKNSVLCEIANEDLVYDTRDVFEYQPDMRYGGLEIFADLGCLEDVLCQMKKTK